MFFLFVLPQQKLNTNQNATLVICGYERYRHCLKLAGRSFLYALVRVLHPDWLTGLNFQLRASDNLHTDSHQNLWISTSKKEMAVCEQGQNIRFFVIFYLYFSLKGSAISDVEAQEHYDKFFEVCTHS